MLICYIYVWLNNVCKIYNEMNVPVISLLHKRKFQSNFRKNI